MGFRAFEGQTEGCTPLGNRLLAVEMRDRAKGGTVKLSYPSHRSLEDAGESGVSHIPTATDDGSQTTWTMQRYGVSLARMKGSLTTNAAWPVHDLDLLGKIIQRS